MTRAVLVAATIFLVACVARPFQGRVGGPERPAPRTMERVGARLQTSPPPGITRTVVLDNPTVLVARLGYEAGKGETSHTHPFSAVVIQLTPGDVDMTLAGDRSRARREAGSVWFIPANTPHMAVNAGTAPWEHIGITIKPTRAGAPAAPPTEAPSGITRTTLVDNADTRVVRVLFAPGSREPVHTHPNDLLTVQLTPGAMDIVIGSNTTTGERAAGFVQFLPRGVEHAYLSSGTKPFELISVAIK